MSQSESSEDRDLKEYYSLRSGEYDLLYEKPDRQADLKGMGDAVTGLLSGRKVLEIACGTGYWTELIADHAKSVLATDTSDKMMGIAIKRTESKRNVVFLISDAYTLDGIEGEFDAAFCGYWISHVRKSRMRPFLENLHAKLLPGSKVVLLDNRYVGGKNTPISKTDVDGNTYQIRKLADGLSYEIVKNFLTEEELMNLTEGMGMDRKFLSYQYYWVFHYTVGSDLP